MNAAVVILAALLPMQATSPASAPAGRHVAVFDMVCPAAPQQGAQLADAVRLKLAAHKEYDVIDRLTMAEHTPAGGLPEGFPPEKLQALLREKLAANVALYGRLDKAGGRWRATIHCLDLSGPQAQTWTQDFSDQTERARGIIAAAVVETLRKSPEWKPPEYGDEKEPAKFSPPLNLNGDFESTGGWQQADNVASFIVKTPASVPAGGALARGNYLKLFTDLDRDAWLKYQQDLRLGKADPKNPPAIGTVKDKYATVAGLEGVHFRSDWIAAAPGQRYWLTADFAGGTDNFFFPKIFVKGFDDFAAQADALSEVSLAELKLSPADFAALPLARRKELIAQDATSHPDRYRRETYRWYLSCRNFEGGWKHYAAPFPPRGGLPGNVKFLRIEVYAYWPPGTYLFDNVWLYADPGQKTPLGEEPPRTPGGQKR